MASKPPMIRRLALLILPLLLMFFYPSPAHGTDYKFGVESSSGNRDANGYQQALVVFGPYLCSYGGQALNITGYLQQYSGYTPQIRFVIYADSNGYPGQLVGYTETWTLTSGWNGWKTLSVVNGGGLTAGAYYWIGLQTSNYVQWSFIEPYSSSSYKAEVYCAWGEPPGTYPSGSASGYRGSFYCWYQYAPPQVQVLIARPGNQTYDTNYIPLELSASGGTIDKVWYNVWSGNAWLYASNQTYTGPGWLLPKINSSGHYALHAWANNTEGSLDEDVMEFTVSLPVMAPHIVAYAYSSRAIRWQEKAFKAAGRYWVFYADSIDGSTHRARFTSSVDGVNWDYPQDLTPAPLQSGSAHLLEYYGECVQAIYNGSHVHVFLRAAGPGGSTLLLYRMGTPQSNGSIAWATPVWQVAWGMAEGQNVDFYAALDSGGYPWISWGYGSGGVGTIVTYVRRSALNNGTWLTGDTWAVSGPGKTNNFLIPLSGGRMYVIYFRAGYEPLYGRLWNGTAWLGEEQVTSSYIYNQYDPGLESWSRGATVDSEDTIHLVFLTSACNLKYVRRTMSGGWSPEMTVETYVTKYASPSILTLDGLLMALWADPATGCICFKQRSIGSDWMGEPQTLLSSLTLPVNYDGGYDGLLNSFIRLTADGRLALLYMTSSSSPYEVRFIPLDFIWTNTTVGPFNLLTTGAPSSVGWSMDTLTFNVTGAAKLNTAGYGSPLKVTLNGERFDCWSWDSSTRILLIWNIDGLVSVSWHREEPIPFPPTPIPLPDAEARPLSVSVPAGGTVEAQLEVRVRTQTVTVLDCVFTGEAASWVTLQASLPATYILNFTETFIVIRLPVRIQPPQDARPGSYTVDVRASCRLPDGAGLMAGTYITITVTPPAFSLGDVRIIILMILLVGVLSYYAVDGGRR